MKKVIILVVYFLIAVTVIGQQTEITSLLTRQNYLDKSERQKTTAKILFGGGFLSFGLGFATLGGKSTNSVDNGIMVIAGAAAMVTSVPFFISASKNKKKAMSISLKNQMIPGLQETGFVYTPLPPLHLKIIL